MRILLPVDGSSYSRYAAEFIASRTSMIGKKPAVEAFYVAAPRGRVVTEIWNTDVYDSWIKAGAEKAFVMVRSPLGIKGIKVEEKCVVGAPAEEIVKEIGAYKPDLVVMGAQGKTNVKKLFMGSVTNAVLAGCDAPVLLVREKPAPAQDALRVGIAVDGSEYSLKAIEWIGKNRELFGNKADFEVLSAVEDFYADLMTAANDCDAPTVSMEDAEKYEQQEFEYATARAIPALQDIGVQPRAVRLVGNPGDAIARYANKEKLDLVVMGSHGFTNFKSAVLGSVATRVAAEAECPILIIR